MYVKLTNGRPENYSIGQLRRDNPQISFPKNPTDEVLATFGVYAVVHTNEPSIDSKTHRHVSAVEQIDGRWTQVWRVEPLSETQASANVRAWRDKLSAECDWTQVADAPVDQQKWAAYRQALRDISAQAGFPWEVVWPDVSSPSN
jgi:hypothetical protein